MRQQVALADVCSLITDGTHYTPPSLPEGVPFLTVKDMGPQGLAFERSARISVEEFERARCGNSAPQVSDVLFSKDGTVGKVHVVRDDRDFAVLSSIAILRANSKVLEPEYLAHALRSPGVLRSAIRRKTGTAIRRVILADLQRVLIPLPALDEQRWIVRVLDTAESARQKRRLTITQGASLGAALYAEMFGACTGADDTLNQVAEITSGITKGRKPPASAVRNVPYLAVSNVQAGRLDLTLVKTIEASDQEVERFRLRIDDLLLTEGGDPDKLGRGALWRGELECCIHQNHVFRVRVRDRDQVEPEFLISQLAAAPGRAYFLRAAKQTTGIASINKTQLGQFPVLVPPIERQREFCRRLSRAEGLVRRQRTHLDQLDVLFASLQQRAFAGEV